MATMDHAGVVLITLAVDDWPERLTGRSGYLVPKADQTTVTAASFGSQKWAHWRGGDGEVLRVSLGRDGLVVDHLTDDELVDRAVTEVGRHIGVDLQPTAVRVSRWPGAFPQYRPHHPDWAAAVAAALPARPVRHRRQLRRHRHPGLHRPGHRHRRARGRTLG